MTTLTNLDKINEGDILYLPMANGGPSVARVVYAGNGMGYAERQKRSGEWTRQKDDMPLDQRMVDYWIANKEA